MMNRLERVARALAREFVDSEYFAVPVRSTAAEREAMWQSFTGEAEAVLAALPELPPE
jgi:hypothetical protein